MKRKRLSGAQNVVFAKPHRQGVCGKWNTIFEPMGSPVANPVAEKRSRRGERLPDASLRAGR